MARYVLCPPPAVSGWEVKSLLLPDASYLEELREIFLRGADPVDAADQEIKEWPTHQRLNEGLQSAEEFRKSYFYLDAESPVPSL